MNRLLMISLLALAAAGCKASSDSTLARSYPCDGGFTDTSQCREGWVCGHSGVCVNPQATEPRLCANDSECGGGWHCGPPDESRFGRCYDRTKPEAFECRRELGVTGGDCRDDWRCGLDARCYDPNTAGAIACLPDAGETGGDCRADWRCGLDERCYNPADAGNVRCDEDEDCAFPDWRCAVTTPRRCAQIAEESLVQRDPPIANIVLRAPLVAPSYTDTSVVILKTTTFGSPVLTYYIVSAAGDLLNVSLSSNPNYQLSSQSDAGVFTALVNTGTTTSANIGGILNDTLFARSVTMPDAGTQLAYSPPNYVVASTTDRVTTISIPSVYLNVPNQYFAGPPSPIRKVLLAPLNGSFNVRHGIFALTDDGLYHAEHNGSALVSPWIAVNLPNAPHKQCPATGWSPTNRLIDAMTLNSGNPNSFAVVTVGHEDGGVTTRRNTFYANTSIRGPGFSCNNNGWIEHAPLPACLPGQTPVRVFPLTDRAYGFDCRDSSSSSSAPYGLASYTTVEPAGGAKFVLSNQGLPRDYKVTPDRGVPPPTGAVATVLSSEGNIFTYDPAVGVLTPEFFSGSPIAATWLPDGGYVVQDSIVGADPSRLYRVETYAGLAPVYPQAPGSAAVLCSGVDGPGHWVISLNFDAVEIRKANDLVPASTMAPAWGRLEGVTPIYAQVCGPQSRAVHALIRNENDADRKPYLLLSGADRIWAGPVESLNPLVPATLPVVAVPAPSTRIDSLTFVEPAIGQPDLFTGYALAQERLFQIRAESKTRWISSELPVPAGKPVAVFNQGSRARIGFSDGRVLSLPGMAPLSPKLKEEVTQYAVLCGRAYATTLTALHRLDPVAGQAEGAWTQVTAPTVRPTVGRSRFAKALLTTDGNRMIVADDFGTIFTVQDLTCNQ